MLVTISKLPKDIQKKLPYSLRSYKSTYDLDELPRKEREIIREYLERTKNHDITYSSIIDFVPKISKYADLQYTGNLKTTILEYLKNYLYTLPGDYPFDPSFGCKLKFYLHQRDTEQLHLLIQEELTNIAQNLSSDLGTNIIITSFSLEPVVTAGITEYKANIYLKIPGEEDIKVTMDAFEPM